MKRRRRKDTPEGATVRRRGPGSSCGGLRVWPRALKGRGWRGVRRQVPSGRAGPALDGVMHERDGEVLTFRGRSPV